MMYDEKKQEAELLNAENLLKKIAREERISRSGIYLDAKYGERLFYGENKLYAQMIYHAEQENDVAMEKRKCALFSLDLGQERKEWHYEKEMSNLFGAENEQAALGKGFYTGIVFGKMYFMIWTEKDENAMFGYYDLKTGDIQIFSEKDDAYYTMISDLDIKGTVEQEMEYEEE